MLAATSQTALCTLGGIGVAASKLSLLRSCGQRARQAGINRGPTAATIAGLKNTEFGDLTANHVAGLQLPIAFGRQPAPTRLPDFISEGMHSVQLTDQCMISGGSELGFERDSDGRCRLIIKGFKPRATIAETEEMLKDKLQAVGPVTVHIAPDKKDRNKPSDPCLAVVGVPTETGAMALVTYGLHLVLRVYPSRDSGETCEGHPLIERLKDTGSAQDKPGRLYEMEADFGGLQGDIVRDMSRDAARAARENPDDDAALGLAYLLEVYNVRPFGQTRCQVEATSVAAVPQALQLGTVRYRGLDIAIRPSVAEGAARRDIDAHCLVLFNLPAAADAAIEATVQEVFRAAGAKYHTLPGGKSYEPLPTRHPGDKSVKIFPASEESMRAVMSRVTTGVCTDITGKRKLRIRLASENRVGPSRGRDPVDLELMGAALKRGISYAAMAQRQQAAASAGCGDSAGLGAAVLQELRSGFARMDSKLAANGRSMEQLQQGCSRIEGKIDQGNSQMGQLVAHAEEHTAALQRVTADQQEVKASVQSMATNAEMQVQLLTGLADEQGSLAASVAASTKRLEAAVAEMARRKAAAKAAKQPSPSSQEPKPKARRRTPGQGGAEGGDLSSQLAMAAEQAAGTGQADVDMCSPTKVTVNWLYEPEGELQGAEPDENSSANVA